MRVSIIAPLAMLVVLGGCGDIQRAEYATFDAAVAEGAVRRGWIPSYVPPSAVDIVETHDLDLNTQRLRFRAPEEDLRQMVSALRPLQLAAARAPGVRSPRVAGDWPVELRDGNQFQSPRASLAFYAAPAGVPGAGCLAVDWATRTVYAWSCTRVT